MKKRIWRVAGLSWAVLLALQTSALAAPAAPEDISETLRRQTQELLDAIASGGAAVWDRYLDAGLSYTTEDGKVYGKKEMVEGIKPLPPGVSGIIRVTDFKTTVHGDVAVATYVADEDEDYHGHNLHCQYRTTETWLETPAGWRMIAGQVLALRTDPPAVPLSVQKMDAYLGRYALTPEIAYEIRRTDAGLEGQQTGRPAEAIQAEAPDVLFVPGKVRYRKIFQRGPDGRVTGFLERREAWDLAWKRLP